MKALAGEANENGEEKGQKGAPRYRRPKGAQAHKHGPSQARPVDTGKGRGTKARAKGPEGLKVHGARHWTP